MITVGSLFAGVGGLELGLERTGGFKTVFQVEIDSYARRVLEKHWPDVRRWDDVRTFPPGDAGEWRCDMLCGGFPCQDISIAGRRVGIEGKRSGLWSEFARIIRVVRPRYVLVENVAAILVRGLGRVLGDLAACGYDAEWDCIPASALGAPHERERLFLIAYPGGFTRRGCFQVDAKNGLPRDEQWRAAQGVTSGRGWKRWLRQTASVVDRIGTVGRVSGVDDGIPHRVDRIAAVGNAVVPQVAEYIGRLILAAINKGK